MRRAPAALTTHVCAQALGVVVAETEAAAREGAALVAVTYADLPAIMSIDDAVDAGSFFEVRRACCGARAPSEPSADVLMQSARRRRQGQSALAHLVLAMAVAAEWLLRGGLGCMGPAGELVQRLKRSACGG